MSYPITVADTSVEATAKCSIWLALVTFDSSKRVAFDNGNNVAESYVLNSILRSSVPDSWSNSSDGRVMDTILRSTVSALVATVPASLTVRTLSAVRLKQRIKYLHSHNNHIMEYQHTTADHT